MKAQDGIVLSLCILAVLGRVSADGCSGGTCAPAENLDPALSKVGFIEGPLTLSGVKELHGMVHVNGSLTIRDCHLSLDGIGIAVGEGGSLTIINSTITPSMPNLTCFISVEGDLSIESSTIRGFTDPRDSIGLIGFYVSSSFTTIKDSHILDSGIFMFYNCSVSASRTELSGAFMQGGDGRFTQCNVKSYGITYDGMGSLRVTDCAITSDISFVNGVSAISATSGADLTVIGTSINGTYSAGIFAQEGSVFINGVDVALVSGIYGVKLDLTDIRTLSGIDIKGASTGVSIFSSTSDGRPVSIGPISIQGGSIGIELQNSVQTIIRDCSISGAESGVRTMGPTVISKVTVEDASIAVLLEGMYENAIEDCSFIDYTSWAIQEQTWSTNIYPQNTFVADPEAPGDIAWWGYVTVDASGTGTGSLKGASLLMRSEIGEYRRSPGRIDVIWGYSDGSDPIPVVYEGEVRWGTSSARFELDPEVGLIRTVEVPLGDISLVSIERDRGGVIVTLGMSGTGSGTADIKVYLDDEEVRTESANLRSGDEVSIHIPLAFPSGTHTVRAEVSSADEYHGADLLENNELSETFKVDDGKDTEIALWAFVAVLLLVLAAAIVNEFGFKRV
jgi:hypothetical protein